MQSGVNISTPEADLQIIYGNSHCGMARLQAQTSAKYLLSDVNRIRETYIRLGFHLYEFERYAYFHDFGYYSLSDFCAANLGMDKSAVSRCMAVFKRFSAHGKHFESGICVDYGNCSMVIDKKYADYSYSQLCEMVSIKDDRLLASIKPDMTIKQIREIKSQNCAAPQSDINVSQSDSNVSQVATSQQATKQFDYNTYSRLSGAARSAYIKSLDNTDKTADSMVVHIFDSNGNSFSDVSNVWLDVLFFDKQNNTVYLRKR